MKSLKEELRLLLELLETNQELEAVSQGTTKPGSKLTFKIDDTSPDRGDQHMNKGFVVHKITALVDGKPAGYIKISYVPTENWKQDLSPAVKFAQNWQNKLYDFDNKPLKDQVFQLGQAIRADRNEYARYGLPPLPDEQLKILKAKYLKELPKVIRRERDKTKKYHVDKPFVDYISVEPEYRRQGIGEALYVVASKYLAKKGMKLYASGLQSNDAKASWENLKTKYPDKIGSEPLRGYPDRKERVTFSHL